MTTQQSYWANNKYRFCDWNHQAEVDFWFMTYALTLSDPTDFADVLSDLLLKHAEFRQGHSEEEVQEFEREGGAETIHGILTEIAGLPAHRHRIDAANILHEVRRVLETGEAVRPIFGRPMLPPAEPDSSLQDSDGESSDSDPERTAPLTTEEILERSRTIRQPNDPLPTPQIRIYTPGNIPLAEQTEDNRIILNRFVTEHALNLGARNGILALLSSGLYSARGQGVPYYLDNPTEVLIEMPHESKVPFIIAPIIGNVDPDLYLDQTRWPMLNIDDLRTGCQVNFGRIQPENYIYQFISLVREILCLPEIARKYVIILRGHPTRYQNDTKERFEDETPPTAQEVECIIRLITMTFPDIEIEPDAPLMDSDSDANPSGDDDDDDDDDDDGNDDDNGNDNDDNDNDDDDNGENMDEDDDNTDTADSEMSNSKAGDSDDDMGDVDNDMDEDDDGGTTPKGVKRKSRKSKRAARERMKRKAENRTKHKYDTGENAGDFAHHDRVSWPTMITINGATFDHIESLHRQNRPYAHLLYFLFTVLNHEMGHYLNTMIWVGEAPGEFFDTPRRLRWWVQTGTTEYEYSPDYERAWERIGEIGEVIEWLTFNYMLEYPMNRNDRGGKSLEITCMGSYSGLHLRFPETGWRQLKIGGYAGTQLLRALPPIRMPNGDELRTFLERMRELEIQAAVNLAARSPRQVVEDDATNAFLAAQAISQATTITAAQAAALAARQAGDSSLEQNMRELLRAPEETNVQVMDIDETFTGNPIRDTPAKPHYRYRRATRSIRRQQYDRRFRRISNLPELSPRPNNVHYGPPPVKPTIRALPESLQPAILIFLAFGLSFLIIGWVSRTSPRQPRTVSGKLAQILTIFIAIYMWFWVCQTVFYPLGRRFKGVFGTRGGPEVSTRKMRPKRSKQPKRSSKRTPATGLRRIWISVYQKVLYPFRMSRRSRNRTPSRQRTTGRQA